MISKLIKALRTDPAGFPRRAASAVAEQARLLAFRHAPGGKGYCVHYGVHRNGNAGDTALFTATRRLFDRQMGRQDWRMLPVRAPVEARDISRINAEAKAVLVGGGGLIIPDSVPGSRSGWQWNLAIEDLRRLERPLVLSAVGYNNFHGQTGFSPQFEAHIYETIERAAFVGLRNNGSIRSLSGHLPPPLAEKLRWQPCPTTVLSRLYPEYDRPWQAGRHLAINLAFDRADRRFGSGPEASVKEIAEAAAHMVAKGWRASFAVHDPRDRFYLPLLRQFGLTFDVVDIAHAPISAIYEYYCTTDLTIGMRGHGQMVPFGLQRPVFTLASHPKMTYFLEDIGHEEWGVDIRQPGFRDRLIAGMEAIADDPDGTRDRLTAAQDRLWSVMQDNAESLRPYF
ncbi:MAG: hypothetical protein CL820_10020 [Croceicoccus sp.]|nr:hypothetical protein [Croceicoccus sp.]MAL26209.1 hypothetical protein [Croceicoccus sp.]|tara:strand:- start:24032 stop:25222 length:1191 start_codon:yes stop_codon:yes gene_type:complete